MSVIISSVLIGRIYRLVGYLSQVCRNLKENLDRVPGDSRTTIGFMTFNSSIHFYDLRVSLALYAIFILYRTVKSITESVPDRASVNTRNDAFEAVSAPEQDRSAPLLKVERSVSDRFLKRSKSSLNIFIGAKNETESCIGK